MPRSKRILGSLGALLTAILIGLWGPALYAQARMATTTGVVYVRGIVGTLNTAAISATGVITALSTAEAGLVINNPTADASVVGTSYLIFQTANVTRWYFGMSPCAGDGALAVYNGINAVCAVSISKAAGSPVTFSGSLTTPAVNVGTALTFSGTAPTIASFGGSGPSAAVVAGSTTAAWRITVGGTAPGTTGTINLPTATTGWNCWIQDQTTPLDITRQTSSTTASVGITSTIAWTANDTLVGGCTAF